VSVFKAKEGAKETEDSKPTISTDINDDEYEKFLTQLGNDIIEAHIANKDNWCLVDKTKATPELIRAMFNPFVKSSNDGPIARYKTITNQLGEVQTSFWEIKEGVPPVQTDYKDYVGKPNDFKVLAEVPSLWSMAGSWGGRTCAMQAACYPPQPKRFTQCAMTAECAGDE